MNHNLARAIVDALLDPMVPMLKVEEMFQKAVISSLDNSKTGNAIMHETF